ncbi:hypothetical protein PM082_019091 [Marasmius tenuissimus]|nr:hypothetical protein PM082_019091 [Marasmius tenuissimus]
MSPKPILKRTPSDQQRSAAFSHGVHFPASPSSLACTFDAYSPSTYDRSPIVVSPNACALPERGCPGRTYTIDEPSCSTRNAFSTMAVTPRGGTVHPRAFQSMSNYSCYSPDSQVAYSNPSSSSIPPLVPDLSSESEESDGFISPPPHLSFTRRSSTSPSSPRNDKHSHYADNSSIIPSSPSEIKVRRRRSSRERGERIRSSPALEVDDPGYEDDYNVSQHCSPPSPTARSRKTRSSRRSMAALTQSLSSFGVQDEGGCLGGF